jgi:hypothetical protein
MSVQMHANTQQIDQPTNMPLLRRALVGDTIFVAISSIAFIASSIPLASLTGISTVMLLDAGVVCLAYAAFLWWAVRNQPLQRIGWINVVLGYVWVAASIVLLVAGWLPLTSFGFWLIVGVAVAVDLITSVQAYALVKRR